MKVLINAERFFLRDLRVSDATKNYLSWFDDKNVKKYIKYSKFKNILDLKKYLKFQIKKKNSIFLGIFNKKGLHIGNVKLDNINFKRSTAVFGILIGNRSWRNKGVTSEVIKALSQWSFKKYKISKFILGVEKKNTQAIKAYKKSNFIELHKNNKNTIAMERDYFKSKLSIGTAQFGGNYGIANIDGETQLQEIQKINKIALLNGINTFDTAKSYGNAEIKLGKLKLKNVDVITKIKLDQVTKNVSKKISFLIKDSLRKLKIRSLYAVLISNPECLKGKRGVHIFNSLKKLRKMGIIKKVGVSIYDPSELNFIIPRFKINIVSVPYNVFDQQIEKSNWFQKLKKKNIEIHTRSTFLQGLLLMKEDNFPKQFLKWSKTFFQWKKIIKKMKKNPSEICLGFALQNPNIDKVTIGIDNKNQFQELIKYARFSKHNLPNIKIKNFSNLLNPSKWKDISIIKKKLTAIIQARLTSTRFPVKVLKTVGNLSIIELLLKRLERSKFINNVIIAIPNNKKNKPLENFLLNRGLNVFKGSENDVLDRYYSAAKKFKLENIIRVTSDCPLIDPNLLDKIVEKYFNSKVDYLSNTNPATFPDGLDVEIFSFKSLEKAWKLARSKYDREHVTTYIKSNKKIFKSSNFFNKRDLSKIRLSLDEFKDLITIKKIFNFFKPNIYFNWEKIMTIRKLHKQFNRDKNKGIGFDSGPKLWKKAKKIIPGGNMLISKRQERFLPDRWPSYFSKTKDCYVWDLDNRKYTDMSLMGVGTNTLGYNNLEVDTAVKNIIKKGNMSTLNCPEEVRLVEKLIQIHPWSSMVKLTRSGGEANAVAIRIARAASGKEKVAICGYHGWHDWYVAANLKNRNNLNNHLFSGINPIGVPKKLKESIFTFEYNKISQLKDIVKQNRDLGIIKMEVRRNVRPEKNFLESVRKISKKNNIILIFDECTSGFRENFGGLHKKYNVIPDIAIFGKALGNGYGINAVVGKSNVMKFAEKSFISSTFWSERIGPTAALKTLEVMEKIKSWKIISKQGKKIKRGWMKLAQKHNLSIKVEGLDSLCSFRFSSPKMTEYKTIISQEMLKKGYLASNIVYVCINHSDKIINRYLSNLDDVFKIIKECEDGRAIESVLELPKCEEGFQRFN